MPLLRKLAFITLVLSSCGKPLPALEGVDFEKWKADKNGCQGDRKAMESPLSAGVDKLKGLAEMDVIALLGKPDQNELYKRNQKFYYYFISPGPACGSNDPDNKKLAIRFNAMGYAQLVYLEKNSNH